MSQPSSISYSDALSGEAKGLSQPYQGVYYVPVQLGDSASTHWVALHGITSECKALQACEIFHRITQVTPTVELRSA